MSLQIGEEKKEATCTGREGDCNWANEDTSDEEDEIEELGDLPQSIVERIGTSFESEEALIAALVEAGVGDLPVILLDGKPRLVIPSDQHNAFTSRYDKKFSLFAKNRWGTSTATHKIHLSNGTSRDPDLSYWGYPQCRRDSEGLLEPIGIAKGAVPDVIIQFSWRNKAEYEENAIDDMMNRALTRDDGDATTRPNVGYLIKVRFSRKRTLQGVRKGSRTQDVEGLDIYRLPHGTTMAHARDPNNTKASHWRYDPNGPKCFITITPGDLGITGVWAFLCGDYKIKASVLFHEMRQMQLERQRDGLAT